jgi:integrase/recombinase XerD
MLKKLFRPEKIAQWTIIDKESIDEIIFRTTKVRNRLILELMARGGMRVGEVLNLTAMDLEDQKLTIKNTKSGKRTEVVFIPKKVAERLKDYIKTTGVAEERKIFPISYTAARNMVKKAGALIGVKLRPHDLRRHAATYASRSGVPVEIVSKVILRHANLSTTQRYLGKVSDNEAVRWIENLYG